MGGVEDDLSDDSIESISSRIGAWTEGAERMCGGNDSNDNRRENISGELTDVNSMKLGINMICLVLILLIKREINILVVDAVLQVAPQNLVAEVHIRGAAGAALGDKEGLAQKDLL